MYLLLARPTQNLVAINKPLTSGVLLVHHREGQRSKGIKT